MRKYFYQMTMRILPIYFTALLIAIVVFALVFRGNQAYAQTNVVALYENLQPGSANLNAFSVAASGPTLFADKIVDKGMNGISMSLNSTKDYVHVNISGSKRVTNIVVYDISNKVVEDLIIDLDSGQIDFSGGCPGIYYIRVDYVGESHLKRMVVPER